MEEASVAGESPDRSKQRESSAEPTSGSADSVPEARDPRLAVAAAKETAGGVDTATRVFSVRDPKPVGEDDTKLREAVAAWVRTSDEDPEGPEAATEPAEGAERPQGDREAPGAPGTPENAADTPGTAPEATAPPKDTAAPEAEPEDAEPEDTRPDGKPEADPEDAKPEDATATSPADPEDANPDPGTQTDTDPEDAKPEAATATSPADPEDANPDPGTQTDTDPEDAKPEATDQADAEPENADPEDRPSADTAPEAPQPKGDSKAPAEPADAKPDPGTQTDTEPEDAKPEADTAPEGAESEGGEAKGEFTAPVEPEDAEPVATAEPEDTRPDGRPEAQPEADPEDAKPEDATATSPADPEDANPDPGTQTDTDPEDAKPEATDQADAEPENADPDDRPKTDTEPDDRPKAEAGVEGRSEVGVADNDGRGQGEGVDQPTTTLKAPRPQQVDQPTTMLKLGGAAKPRTPEAEAERTSKFVALKSDIKPGSTSAGKPESKPEAEPDSGPEDRPETASTTRTSVIPQVGPERTTQQPLPPKPPLDLLAELTNTPRPPETPVRTAVRRVKIWTPLVIVLLIVFAVAQTLRPLPQPTLDLSAKDTYTFDGGKVDIPWPADGQAALDVQGIGSFGSSGDQKPVPIASVAKVMTAYIILRDHPLKSGAAGPKIKIDQAAQDQANAGQESTVDVTAGDSITQREALESILIASANNVARLLARWDAGSEKSFVSKMNATAKKLGMTNTTYTDPSGLTNSTVSTAVDQVKLAKAAMASEPAFREVAAMMSYDDYKGVNHGNWNQLVGQNNVVGIKTGTTTSALGNLVFAAKKDVNGETRTVIGAVIRQPANASNDNSILKAALNAGDRLIRAAQGALKSATIYKKGDVVGYVDDRLGGRTPVVATKDVTAVGWSGLKVKLTFAADDVPHTAKAGTQVGTLTVGDGSGSAVQVPVALEKDLAEPGFAARLTRLG
ncbi:D-alanyl-D-alanine carboxypeptidase [Streptomyces sp. NPDC007162]|uniref:serine hydrolase n=1 Tax=Streptomyces sp. NPDC007162 TaxID=3156917 RepID=UPI00340256AD